MTLAERYAEIAAEQREEAFALLALADLMEPRPMGEAVEALRLAGVDVDPFAADPEALTMTALDLLTVARLLSEDGGRS